MQKIIRDIVKKRGAEVITSVVLVSCMDDEGAFTTVESRVHKKILRAIISDGYARKLLDVGAWNEESQTLAVEYAKKNALNEDVVSYVFKCLAFGLGWTRSTPTAPKKETPSADNVCLHCGTALPIGAKFCTSCGTPVGAQNKEKKTRKTASKSKTSHKVSTPTAPKSVVGATVKSTAKTTPQQTSNVQTRSGQPSATSQHSGNAPSAAQNSQKKGSSCLLWIVLLAVGIGLLWWGFSGDDDAEPDDINTEMVLELDEPEELNKAHVSKTESKPREQKSAVDHSETTVSSGSQSINYAAVRISVEKNAEIWINDKKKGSGAWSGNLEAGSYLIECKLANHRTTSKEITVVPGKAQTIKMDAPTAITGTLDISCNEPDAEIYLDGKKIGTTPMIVSDCMIGKHTLKITKDGKQYSQEVEVSENKECAIYAKLPQESQANTTQQSSTNNSTTNPVVGNTITYTAIDKINGNFNKNKIVSHTFNNGLGTITFANNITSIDSMAFRLCSLTSITLPNTVTSIEVGAFSACLILTTITIPNSVTSIGPGAFYGCTRLKSINIPNSVTNIEDYVFGVCKSLKTITIPNSVTNIGKQAFVGCKSLTSITCHAINPPSLTDGDESFTSAKSVVIYVPSESISKYQQAEGWRRCQIKRIQ